MACKTFSIKSISLNFSNVEIWAGNSDILFPANFKIFKFENDDTCVGI